MTNTQLGLTLWARCIRAVEQASLGCAMLGGALFMLMAVMTVVSVIGRAAFATPVPGDVEITQYAVAVAISACLPWCLFAGGNLIVDFFTTRASARVKRGLDVAGALALAFTMALFAWRTTVGLFAIKASGETSMVISMPLWWAYAGMAPCFALATLAALALAAKIWRRENTDADDRMDA